MRSMPRAADVTPCPSFILASGRDHGVSGEYPDGAIPQQ